MSDPTIYDKLEAVKVVKNMVSTTKLPPAAIISQVVSDVSNEARKEIGGKLKSFGRMAQHKRQVENGKQPKSIQDIKIPRLVLKNKQTFLTSDNIDYKATHKSNLRVHKDTLHCDKSSMQLKMKMLQIMNMLYHQIMKIFKCYYCYR